MPVGAVAYELPREIVPGVFWLGGCLDRLYAGEQVHAAFFAYLVVGTDATLLVDTGHPRHWSTVSAHLDRLLGGRPLDLVFPTHPEMQHAGNLGRLLRKYPGAAAVGDLRDYHLHFPEFEPRLMLRQPGDVLDLGGKRITFLEPAIRDLRNTLWAYESDQRLLFVADGLSYLHHHAAGECALLSGELPAPVDARQVTYYNETAFPWSAYLDAGPLFDRVDALLRDHPVRFIAPAHGNVISDPGTVIPAIRAATVSARRG